MKKQLLGGTPGCRLPDCRPPERRLKGIPKTRCLELVLTAFANKPARLIGGKTGHGLTKLRGGQSMTIAQLRVKNDKGRRALAAVWAPVGALVKDEFTQQPAC